MSFATNTAAIPAIATSAPGVSRISWGAVIAGVFVVLSIQLLLTLLGAGVGLSSITPSEATAAGAKTAGVASAGWIGVATLISLLVGGMVAGRLSGASSRNDGMLHGVLTWAAVLVLTLYLLSSAVGSLFGTAFSAVGGTVGAIAETAKQAAPSVVGQAQQAAGASGVGMADVTSTVDSIFGTTTSDPSGLSRDDARREVLTLAPQIARGGPDAEAARQRAVAIVAAQMKITPDEANRRIDDAQRRATEAKDQAVASAKASADVAASASAKGAFGGFVTLGIALLAAAIGGALGAGRRREIAVTP